MGFNLLENGKGEEVKKEKLETIMFISFLHYGGWTNEAVLSLQKFLFIALLRYVVEGYGVGYAYYQPPLGDEDECYIIIERPKGFENDKRRKFADSLRKLFDYLRIDCRCKFLPQV